MTTEEEITYLRGVIRKLIFSNIQRDYSEDNFYLDFGVYKIKLNPHEDMTIAESVDYFMEQIAYIDANHDKKVKE